MIPSLYIHIPFCDHICTYCDFPKVLTGTFSDSEYIDSLLFELDSKNIDYSNLKTIYIGGGTPTSLSYDSLKRLLSYLKSRISNIEEFTVEANPESVTEAKVLLMKECGVTRISLGVQSLNDEILHYMNRRHTNKDTVKAINTIISSGIKEVNLDFIYGVDGMKKEDILDDIAFAVFFAITHLSFYSLQIEKGTILYNKNSHAQCDESLAMEYELITNELAKRGFIRYEVSNFALQGHESKHNLNYWHDGMYYACGLGASGYEGNIRYKNTCSMNKYLKHEYVSERETLDKDDEEFEFLMLGLRLKDGFSLAEFKKRFNKDFLIDYKDRIENQKEFLEIDDGRVKIKDSYLFTMDSVLLSLLKFKED